MSKINWQKDMKDTMWAMFWLKENAGADDMEIEKEGIKENVARLIRMATQKNAGQRGAKDCVDWNCLEHTMLSICCHATALCLAGEFGPMPETIEEADNV